MRDPSISFHRSAMVSKNILPQWRSRLLLLLLTAGFLVLLLRALWVQGIHHEFYIFQGERRYARSMEEAPTRARILDRNGTVLAISEGMVDVWVEPEKFSKADVQQRALVSKTLNLAPTALNDDVWGKRKFVYLKRQATLEASDLLRAAHVPGLVYSPTSRRAFPAGPEIANVIGLTNIEGHGNEGVELARDGELSGTPGHRRVIVDRLGRVIEQPFSAPASPGTDVTLTIDMRIQRIAMEALAASVEKFAASGGSAIVVDTHTGEILSLANVPTFDPADLGHLNAEAMRNRAFTDSFEPGSTIKPLTVAHALENHKIDIETRFDTSPGVIDLYGSSIRDTSDHGVLTPSGIIAKSSNIGMVRIAQRLQADEMWNNFRLFGLGERPLSRYPGIAFGSLRPAKRWKPIEQATMAYGYGLSVTLAQLAEAYTVFGNDGARAPLRLYRDDPRSSPIPVVSPHVSQQVLGMLEQAVEPGGTARMAQLTAYRSGAKTGTARKQSGNGYARGKYRAVFVGLAPIETPRLVVAVMIDTPTRGSYYGGPVAGPVFNSIMQRALQILSVPPDRLPIRG